MGFFQSSGILNRRGFFGGAAKAFSPSNISGLQLWLDATTGLFDATSGGNAVTTDGSAVARWEDQSGNGYHATQGTSNNRPVLKTSIQNGKNILRFDGSNDVLLATISASSPRTTFAVAKIASTTAAWRGLWAFNGSGTDGSLIFIFQQAGSANDKLAGGRAAAGYEITYSIAPGTNFFVGSQINTLTKVSGRLNKSSAGSLTHSSLSIGAGNETRIGAGRVVGSENWYGDIAEIISYNSELTTSDIESVENYLASKWGI